MQATQPKRGDLRTLKRGGNVSSPGAPASSAVPPPKFNYKTRVVLPGGILFALLALIAYSARDSLLPAREVTVVPVVLKDLGGATAAAQATGDASPSTPAPAPAVVASGGVQAPGWVEADPFPIAVSALADGIVREVLALEGQHIKAGDIVARLVDDDAKLNVARAQADLAEKKATLEAAQRRWDNPIDLTRAVDTTQAMVNSSRAMLTKLQAEAKVESARLTLAKEEFERTREATTQRALSEIDLIRARQQHEAQQATLAAVVAQQDVVAAELAQRQAELTAARENLRLRIEDAQALAEAKAAVANAEARCDEAHLRLDRMQVRATTDGIVMQRHVTPGSKVMLEGDDMLSATVVHLYDPKKLQVRVDVPLADAAKVGVDQPAQVVVGVLPNQTFNGRVTRVVHEADIQKNTLQVKVAIENPSPQLKPEMLARVRFLALAPATPTATKTAATATTRPTPSSQAIFAPAGLVHRHGDDASTYLADRGRGVAIHKTIRLGQARIEGWVQVESGLNVGDALIVEQKGLRDGQRIRITGEADDVGADHAEESREGHEAGDHGTH